MTPKKLEATLLFILGSALLIGAIYSIENRLAAQGAASPAATSPAAPESTAQPFEARTGSQARLDAIATLVREQISGSQEAAEETSVLDDPSDGIYLALRAGGVELASTWTDAGPAGDLLIAAVEAALDELGDGEREGIDTVELCISYNRRAIEIGDLPSNIERGLVGIGATYAGSEFAFGATEMIAKNLSFDNALERLAEAFGISTEQLIEEGDFYIFDCEQILVFMDPSRSPVQMFRGNQVVPIEDVDLESAQDFAELASAWLVRQIQEDGRMLYRYFPSRGEESSGNNMIRQWMATLAVDRIIAMSNDPEILAKSRQNILYNLEHFYHMENGLGIIEYNETVKLGAIALAGLALVEHPDAEDFGPQIEALAAGVQGLWREDGSFQTFYRPENRIGQNQNFYPGEALLFWSVLYEKERDPELLQRFMKSFEYYRDWHLENRNPAFIPWHTQAYYNVWQITEDPELLAFIFETNDWLVDFQEIERSTYADTPGRFYDAGRPQYGPPHASSTGVYIEGLVDAYLLAREVGDTARQERYARAIRYALRSLMQLQFVDDVDMYYISKRDNVLGGVRTTVYDNSIRVDNVQHGLMGVLKILGNPEVQTVFEHVD